MYVTKTHAIILKRRAIYEDRLIELRKKLDNKEITTTDYEQLKAVYELVLQELSIIDNI